MNRSFDPDKKKWKKSNINYYGMEISDPYFELEDFNTTESQTWLTFKGQKTGEYYGNRFARSQQVYNGLYKLWHPSKSSVYQKVNNCYFRWELDRDNSSEIQDHAVLYRKHSLEAIPIPVIDPNKIDSSGKTSVYYLSFSLDGCLVAFTLSKDGSDWQSIGIIHTQTLFEYKEIIEGCKSVKIAWNPDNSGFFYNGFITTASTPTVASSCSCIYWHKLNTAQGEDKLTFLPSKQEMDYTFYPETSQDGRFLILYASQGSEPSNRVYYREMDSAGPFRNLIPLSIEAQFVYIGNRGSQFFFQTDWQAPNGQIISIDLSRPEPKNWQVLIPEYSDCLAFCVNAGDKLVTTYLHNGSHCLKIFSLEEGRYEREIPLWPYSTITGLTGSADSKSLFFSLESFTRPTSQYLYDVEKGQLTLLEKSTLDFNSDKYETTQIFFPSDDGTPISMFLTGKKGLHSDMPKPTLLTGYGGFGINLTPQFSISQAFWLEQGGVLAVPNIRGGGEYGLLWHEKGRMADKQNSFTDFCAAAEWLINHRYTTPEKLAIMGHSNGGLLVAASLVQKPQLFGAVVCRAPLTDMLRYHLKGAGRNWLREYGCAETNRDQFEILYAYSPLHNITLQAYPALLISVSLHDERVHPMHALKFLAKIEDHSISDKAALLRIETAGGHGLGNTAGNTLAELADIYTFLLEELGMD